MENRNYLYNNLGFFDERTGHILEEKVAKMAMKQEKKDYYSNLVKMYYKDKNLLNKKEMNDLMKIYKITKPLNIMYENGFVMLPRNDEGVLSGLSIETRGVIFTLGFKVNKEGVLIYKNMKPIRKISDLQEHLGFKRHTWTRIRRELTENKVLKELHLDNGDYVVVNPFYLSNDYKISYFKFMAFWDIIKTKVSEMEYNYMKVYFEIDPETGEILDFENKERKK